MFMIAGYSTCDVAGVVSIFVNIFKTTNFAMFPEVVSVVMTECKQDGGRWSKFWSKTKILAMLVVRSTIQLLGSLLWCFIQPDSGSLVSRGART